jgi:hypothetical protein
MYAPPLRILEKTRSLSLKRILFISVSFLESNGLPIQGVSTSPTHSSITKKHKILEEKLPKPSIFKKSVQLKGTIEIDVKLVKSVETVCSSLVRMRTFNKIAACMVEPGENEV